MASHELASRFYGIRENLQKLKEAIANGFLQDAMLLATQVNSSQVSSPRSWRDFPNSAIRSL
jgi:hypothetical protein